MNPSSSIFAGSRARDLNASPAPCGTAWPRTARISKRWLSSPSFAGHTTRDSSIRNSWRLRNWTKPSLHRVAGCSRRCGPVTRPLMTWLRQRRGGRPLVDRDDEQGTRMPRSSNGRSHIERRQRSDAMSRVRAGAARNTRSAAAAERREGDVGAYAFTDARLRALPRKQMPGCPRRIVPAARFFSAPTWQSVSRPSITYSRLRRRRNARVARGEPTWPTK